MKSYITLIVLAFVSFIQAQVKLEVGEFNHIEAFDKLNVKLVKSNSNSMEVLGPKANEVEFVNKNRQLKVRMKTEGFLQGDDVKVIVYYKELKAIHANEGSFITSDETIEAGSLELNSKEGSYIVLNVDVDQLNIKTNTGGQIEAMGSADSQIVVSNSGGNYDGENLKTQKTEVTVNAGGEAKVYASKSAVAKTRAGGNIHIFGGAEVTQKSIAGGNVHIH